MQPSIRTILAFLGGLAAGGSAVYLYLNEKYKQIAQEEIDEYRCQARSKMKAAEDLEKAFEDGKEAYEAKKQEIGFTDYTAYSKTSEKDILNDVSNKSDDKDFDIHMADREYPEDNEYESELNEEEQDAYLESLSENDRIAKEMDEARESGKYPYIIERGEYLNGKQWYEKLDYIYYEGDDTLADDKDEPIDDPEDIVGSRFRELFGRDADDPDVLYIRNEQRGADFEISRVNRNYDDEYPWNISSKNSDDESTSSTSLSLSSEE